MVRTANVFFCSSSTEADVEVLFTLLEETIVEVETSEDREDAIVYFVAGYIARGLL
jgi:hypothetical protein